MISYQGGIEHPDRCGLEERDLSIIIMHSLEDTVCLWNTYYSMDSMVFNLCLLSPCILSHPHPILPPFIPLPKNGLRLLSDKPGNVSKCRGEPETRNLLG